MPTVLVVDDEFGIVELFEAILQDEGYRVLTAVNGKLALEILANERPDLIFLDFMMPVMDGPSVLRAIARNPELVGVPIVLMSSMLEPAVRERCSGYTFFLPKPFKISHLIALTAGLIAKESRAAPDGCQQQ
jgi:CheY-like chemotaxis protein